MDIITKLAGISSELKRSSRGAADAIVKKGPLCFRSVLDTALSTRGTLSMRCAEACSRAVRRKPAFAASNKAKIIHAIKQDKNHEVRYYFTDMLLRLRPGRKEAMDCALMIQKWLDDEIKKGPRAAYLEAIVAMSSIEPRLGDLADRLLDEAFQSSVPSYAARARQILKRESH